MDLIDLPYSTANKTQPVRLRMGEGTAGLEAVSIVQAFDTTVAKFGDKPALHQKILKPVS